MINNDIKKYIEENVFPSYEKNDAAHNINHIHYVIRKSLNFAKTIKDINLDMVYTIASYHDIGHYIDKDNHEKISADMMLADDNLKKFFTDEQIKIMADAVYDHRSSLKGEPRTIYGKIVSSADRNTSVSATLKRTYNYRIKHNPELTIDELIEEARLFILKKFGPNGYARSKMYFEDNEYDTYLKIMTELAENKELFKKEFMKVNNIE